MSKSLFIITASAFALSACGGGATGGTKATASNDSFNPTDACAILPKEKVAAAVGMPVTSANLSAVTQPTEAMAGFSTCTYTFSDGTMLGFFTRKSPEYDGTPEGMARTRKAVTDGMGTQTADVAGLGTSAFSAEMMHQLHVFFGGDKYIYFMADKLPGGKPILDAEKTLAKAVIG
jgi:hypothetical protein